MAKFISLGKNLTIYKYIIWVIIFNLLKDLSFGSHNVEYIQDLRFLDSGNLNNCYYIHQMLCYLATIIFATIAYNKENRFMGRNSIEYSFKKLENKIKDNQTLDIELIHNEQEIRDYPDKYLFIIISIWVFNEEVLNYYNGIFMHLDFWMLELIIITICMRRMLNLKIYNHQILMMILSVIPFILKLVTIILSCVDDNNKLSENSSNYRYSEYVNKMKIIYVTDGWLSFWFFLYLGLIIIRSIINTKIKWLIDLKYISLYKILIIYGVFGSVFCLVISLIATFFSCGEKIGEYRNEFFEYFCTVEYDNHYYLESFKTFFLSGISNAQIGAEIVKVLFGIVAFIGYRLYFLRTIEHLTPIHLIFAVPIHYMFNKSYLAILNYIKNDSAWIEGMDNASLKFGLDFCSDFFAIFGYLVYLEVIELNFCGLDFNLRRKILARGIIDVYKADPNVSSNSGSEYGRSSSAGQISNSSINESDF